LTPCCATAGCRRLLAIGAGDLAKIAFDALVDLLQPTLHLRLGEITIAGVHRLELAAVNGNEGILEQVQLPAQRHERTAHQANRFAIILPEAKTRYIQVIDEHVDDPHSTVLSDILVKRLRKKYRLMAVLALDKTAHQLPLQPQSVTVSTEEFLHSLDPNQPLT